MKRRGFTLVELLVVVSIILVLMTLIGGAVSGARSSQKKQSTKALISKLDTIIQQQYATYATRTVARTATMTLGGAARRQMATGDMPDNWKEIAALKEETTGLASSPDRKFPLNAAQRAYVEYYNALNPSPKYEDAECLFMIVMLGGLTDCLDCGGLGLSEKGDKDGDKALEFWDAWGNPIGFVLWPAGLELPPGSSRFFSTTAPFSGGAIAAAKGGLMRPLIYSAGPDGIYSVRVPDTEASDFIPQIKTGTNCGNPNYDKAVTFGAFSPGADDITSFDAEVGK